MSMTNLLPWRQQRRARRLRFWGKLSAAASVLTLITVFSLRMHANLKQHALQAELAGMQTVQRVLSSRLPLATPAPTRQPRRRAWQPVLTSLSDAIPAQAWFTELRYQHPSVTISGYASALPALSAMGDVLRHIAGFTSGPAGEIRQDGHGRWMFTFQLTDQG
ncbi:PilN domain-containing protein [Enterobacter cloacae]|uniref:PilN domain-containing protein n=1 Tax=Enterobacter cloacae TaxID=550 RepID=UPI00062CA8FC|nr:PilN domain-containing protein [Enterobacter cloacae]ELE9014181.1 PilN domain-containing protein [Enterobacter cloacae]KKY77409.1 pilus assembly protein HofN [Enterobacter cloacae]MCU6230121.1 PilN domain-containing protein [Enterobacter cloacae]MDR9933874.1 PilN domain-containing protein [Enterobacter cloacae subsp. dissolvens]